MRPLIRAHHVVLPLVMAAAALITSIPRTTHAFLPSPRTVRRQYSYPFRHGKNQKPCYASASSTPLGGILDMFSAQKSSNAAAVVVVVQEFVNSINHKDVDKLLSLFAETGEFDDYAFAAPIIGKEEMERRFRLQLDTAANNITIMQVTDMAVSSNNNKVGLLFHYKNTRGCAFFVLLNDNNNALIQKVDWVMESSLKSGENSLRLLSAASKVIEATGYNPAAKKEGEEEGTSSRSNIVSSDGSTAPERYFAAWSRRDLDVAVDVFADNVTYDDTAFPEPFSGKENLRKHLIKCADALPPTFTFEVDGIVADNKNNRATVRWHVENAGEPLPFTRGCSFYVLDRSSGLIKDGIDFLEPTGPIKPGGITLFLDSMKSKISEEPVRLIPIAAWIAYMYIVFFSDGILPGANALQLEQRTWQEVLDLSLNFFLVAPLLKLPFSPVVHPMLEGVFNLLLSWAAMFAGFLSDDRRDKPNLLPMVPIVVGMQLLTSAFLLPYLATRTTETRDNVIREDLTRIAQICESRALGASMGLVGTASIVWFFIGRLAEFGALSERWVTFMDLLSIDRVGSSFIVDLVLFGLFQGWLVDDDLKRRGLSNQNSTLERIAKYVPFFGMAAYLMFRPPLPSNNKSVKDV